MSHSLRLRPSLAHNFTPVSTRHHKPSTKAFKLSIRSCSAAPENASKLVAEVKTKLENQHSNLPVGKYGRDDEEMILWFLKDRKFSVEETVSKLTKAISWRKDFRVSELSEESVKRVAETGKAYLHNYLDVHGRPVLIVEGSKHFPGLDAFYCYYPRRLGQVLFVDAPFIFKPFWQLVKPLLKSYASLVRFCSAKEVKEEYFAADTIPASFK
ncbi:phosphatidylinositol/phosphatidylcholine transfer protein SFH5 isoform X4 [Salvia miltiorrhiza]|uniref:phosphatidylinositol/phosphatidylcholine transfer protein SFH5 isoform X4 n=1 Tax=Salvia miltiorrhiza TaxID=226208 RepID=UPI0025AD78D9|nr:phosphatidylinositol/phosphatidylcholine transfer protein SFH5 isoform X4 [Salvia miltiorrhiza]XP_057804484.1 phosphatidylinositol/phosphatidylcholine transfer protein SFH5 isoform X4 [Salvia miltiorrhiza]